MTSGDLPESACGRSVPSIGRAERDGYLPLSYAQQRLWFLAQMQGVSQAYHISFSVGLRGGLDKRALRSALDRILAPHEALRTTFLLHEEEPVQRITAAEQSRFLLIEQRLSGTDPEALGRTVAEGAGAGFDLPHGPLIRRRLPQLGDDQHALLITMHHIVSDGWSMGVLVHEPSTLYNAYRRGEQDPLPALEIQYPDYAIWQRKWIEGNLLQQQAEYWKNTLADAPALLELPTDHARPAEQDYSGAVAELSLDPSLTAALRTLSRRHGTTLYMTLLSAWAVLLSRLSGQQDMVIGTPAANRGRAEIENLIGFFVNTLALRIDLSTSPTVKALLEQVKGQVLAGRQHQDIPFEQVVEIMKPVRSLTHSPLFQVMFAWNNTAEDVLTLPGL